MGLVDNYYQNLVERRGQAAVLIVPGEGTYDEYNEYIPGVPVEHSVTVIVTQYTTELIAASYGLISPDDLRVYIYNTPAIVEPETTNTLRLDGKEYGIVAVRKRAKAAPVIAYDLQVRHG